MLRPDRAPGGLCLAVVLLGLTAGGLSCSSGLPARPPEFDPRDQTKCSVARSQARPLLVEWPAADRASLESNAQRGLVAVHYAGCEMEVLPRCRAKGRYVYVGLTRKQDRVVIKDVDDLYAHIPAHAAAFEAKLLKVGQLNVSMTIVGQFEADRTRLKLEDFEGECEGATHAVTALTAGAFEFYAGAETAAAGQASLPGAAAGARSEAQREVLNHDGDDQACLRSTKRDSEPPDGCGALIRVEVAPLGGPPRPPAPASTLASGPSGASPAAVSPPPPRDEEADDAPCPAEMARIPGGTMLLSDPAPPAGPSPAPRRVRVGSFCLDKQEISTGRWNACVAAGHCSAEELRCGPQATYPEGTSSNVAINCVSYEEAAAFCAREERRLPTEDEWEWAARGGPRAWKYPWGENPAWVKNLMTPNLSNVNEGMADNPQGVHMLVGGVWEWTTTEVSPGNHLIRGGAFNELRPELFLVRTSRLAARPGFRNVNLGFRCAK